MSLRVRPRSRRKKSISAISVDTLGEKLKLAAKIHVEDHVESEVTVEDMIERCRESRIQRVTIRATARKLLYQSLADALTLTGLAMGLPTVRKQIKTAARAAEIPQTKATPIALLVVKLCLGGANATASQRAQAINGALLKKLSGEDLPKRLKTEGIARLAAFYRAAERRANAANCNAANASVPKSDPPIVPVEFGFTDRALKLFEEAVRKDAYDIDLSARRGDNGGWLIERVRVYPNRK